MRQALEKAEELCSQVNEGVREKENSDRLEWIQAHVQCEGLSEVCDDHIHFLTVQSCLTLCVYRLRGISVDGHAFDPYLRFF